MKRLIEIYKEKSLPARAAVWFTFSSIVQKGIITLTTPIFTRLLSQEEYGEVAIYNSWMNILYLISTFALTTGVVSKAMIKYKEQRWKYISSILTLVSFLTVVIFSTLTVLKTVGGERIQSIISIDKSLIIVMGVDVLFTSALSLWTIKNRFEYRYKEIVIVTVFSNVLGTVISLLLVVLFPERKVFYRIFGTVLTHIIVYFPIYIAIMKKGKTWYEKEYWRYSVLYNAPLIPHYLSQQVLNQSDRIMISSMTGNTNAGIYSLAYQIAIAIRLFTDSIFSSFDPWMFQKIEAGEISKIGKRAVQIELIIGTLCCVFSLFAPEMIVLMGGKAYASAAYLIPPISMSVLFITIYTFLASIEFYYEKTGLIMIASCMAASLNILLNWFFIRVFGYVAAAYTTLFCYIVYALVHYVFMLRICREKSVNNPFPSKMIWPPAIVFAFLSLAISSLYRFNTLRYIIIAVIFAILCYVVRNSGILKLKKEDIKYHD